MLLVGAQSSVPARLNGPGGAAARPGRSNVMGCQGCQDTPPPQSTIHRFILWLIVNFTYFSQIRESCKQWGKVKNRIESHGQQPFVMIKPLPPSLTNFCCQWAIITSAKTPNNTSELKGVPASGVQVRCDRCRFCNLCPPNSGVGRKRQ